MSFRSEFADKLHTRYATDVLQHKSLVADWNKIRGYFSMFLEDIKDVSEFALAKVDESETELSLLVEGHELTFRKHNAEIQVVANGKHIADFVPTVDGYCMNAKEQKVLDAMDGYMRFAFYETFTQL